MEEQSTITSQSWGYPMCTETISPFCQWKLLCTWEVSTGRFFRVSSMESKSLPLRPCWEGPTVEDDRLVTCGVPKPSINIWLQGSTTTNKRLRLLQKNNTTVTGGSNSALALESFCDFYTFISLLPWFQRTGYVESPTKAGKLTVTCSGSVSHTGLSKGKEYTLETKPLCSSNFVPVKSVQLFHITSQNHSAFPKVF